MALLQGPAGLPQITENRAIRALNSLNRRFELFVSAVEVVPGALTLDRGIWDELLAIKVEDIDRCISFVDCEGPKVDARNEVLVLVGCHPVRPNFYEAAMRRFFVRPNT